MITLLSTLFNTPENREETVKKDMLQATWPCLGGLQKAEHSWKCKLKDNDDKHLIRAITPW
jgi:hypothetical protein